MKALRQIVTASLSFLVITCSSIAFSASINIQSGTISLVDDRASGNWQTVLFDESFNSPPSVVAQTVTYNGGEDPNIRIRNITEVGFQMRFDEQNSASGTGGRADGNHITEEVSWIAVGD